MIFVLMVWLMVLSFDCETCVLQLGRCFNLMVILVEGFLDGSPFPWVFTRWFQAASGSAC